MNGFRELPLRRCQSGSTRSVSRSDVVSLDWTRATRRGSFVVPSRECRERPSSFRHVADEWLFIGPLAVPHDVPIGRIRLNAFGREVYIGRTVRALRSAVSDLRTEISKGTLRPVGRQLRSGGAPTRFLKVP